MHKPFGITWKIDRNNLEALGLASVILEYISHDGWDKIFSIDEPTYRELTLEVLRTIKVVKHSNFVQQRGTLSFQAFGKKHNITHTQLAVYSTHTNTQISLSVSGFPITHITCYILGYHHRVKEKEDIPNVQPRSSLHSCPPD